MKRIGHYVDGQQVDGGDRVGPVYNPATGEQTGEVALASASDLETAVSAAQKAQPGWRATPLSKRQDIMFKLRQIVTDRKEELARIITAEHGKVVSDAAGEVSRGLENVDWCTNLMQQLKGDYSENVANGVDVHSVRQPLGVVACITPFNFPVMIPLWMATTAIACGNAVILKPSERDPSAALWLAEAFAEAGLPAGVLNVVNGDADTVNAILDHKAISAVSFVGSTPIAEKIYTRAAANGKRVQALGGAKNHMVVMPDADLDSAADAAVSAAYGSAGERCMAVSVAVAVGEAGDALVEKIAERMPKLKVGDGTDPESEMGPLITQAARDRVAGYVEGASGEGAKVVVDGTEQKFDNDGFFIGVSLVDDVKPGMKVYDDEIFGPVLSVVRVDSYDEAVDLINANQYANGVAVFTRDGKTARQFEFDIEVGMVGVNVPIPVPIGTFSFGGWKRSLFGDTHMYGAEGFNFYTRRKVVTTRWPEPSESQISLGFPTH
ncbi:malonate-semialdehyde dehydrogenase (acetylating)/methylmalonate-semialdehyde dehydrogenase [Propionibacteriaceae bacterium ES.041]|uniref:methylmalonate-semialdehyde dehydrogenase (CoA acylating) n=1 Tax=Enemella evansiae TaxID=2016499 RepID=A0A255G704_9ACTN|nr:CoA-acylating methylmalonate-semialdehyde dehydrogenase [Enemella evansiae]PFG66095.1 malonate-semialdehyde dehydrogenase (acetylating)/methylmalonate-semialdehyde dehydrogenase [Propionibacteriaceae bacterium ES.041]OYO04716.1 methylmalonate-semialdehyde dehydrogenase (CoA acylating) [Enemella evansiae]OYO04898.1 methylmalonate-semialdehyde dehydrogenase (CoA acylating) [Enemella evansiae]OYO09049.1 methylmalonate-semialdehyde dehydrogenase (CoA acylating) [Enemella evansiae]OYO11717.1 met